VSEIRLSPDGSTITVFLPMAWRRRPKSPARSSSQGPRTRPPVAADAGGGEYGTLAEMADAERISRSYVSRILRLTLLAPDIVERILDGRPTAGLPELLRPFPVEWERQRERFY